MSRDAVTVKHIQLKDNEINYFMDLSPLSRYLSNITFDEEEKLMEGDDEIRNSL